MKILKRIIVGIVLLILAIVLFVIGSIMVDAFIGSERVAGLSNIEIPTSAGPNISAHIARPSGDGPHPAVIMLHDWRGVSEDVNGKADVLAQEGYVVIAPDTYRGSTTTWFPRSMYLAMTTPTERVNTDMDAVFTWLESQPDIDPERIAIMGFCYGGGKSLQYAMHNNRLASTIIFYGTLVTDTAMLSQIASPLLGIFGELDGQIPPESVNEFEAALESAGVENQISIYSERGHGFVENAATIVSDPKQQAAWNELVAFLNEHL